MSFVMHHYLLAIIYVKVPRNATVTKHDATKASKEREMRKK